MQDELTTLIKGAVITFLSMFLAISIYLGWLAGNVLFKSYDFGVFDVTINDDTGYLDSNEQIMANIKNDIRDFEKYSLLDIAYDSDSTIEISLTKPFFDGLNNNPDIIGGFTPDTAEDLQDEFPEESRPFNAERAVVLESGETIGTMLESVGLTSEIWKIVNAMAPIYPVDKVPAGKKFILIYEQGENNEDIFKGMRFAVNSQTTIELLKDSEDKYNAVEVKKPTIQYTIRSDVKIANSLTADGAAQNIPKNIIANMTNIFASKVNFSKDIKVGDEYSILYECDFDLETGNLSYCSDIMYTEITTRGKTHKYYAYRHQDGKLKYYTENGIPQQKSSAMIKPVSGVRISSNFGYRRHPITKKTSMHSGIDFAARSGTPIKVVSDGVIVKRGRYGTAGNMVVVKHDSKYTTRYLHMSSFAKGQSVGSRVERGQVIGYVGSTGRSTGPHLHFELLANGRAINPLSIKSFGSVDKVHPETNLFKKEMAKIENLYNITKANDAPTSEYILALADLKEQQQSFSERVAKSFSVDNLQIKSRPQS